MPHANVGIAELAENIPVRVEREGMKLVVIRTQAGIFAYEDVCPHAFWPLSEGTVQDGALECPGHGWEFRVEDGRCVNAPAYCLTPIAVRVEGGEVVLSWEQKRLAATR
jgi:nitrite reductase/ring-hydroxylating ferredoxin subunit